jgi:hypothetical protein
MPPFAKCRNGIAAQYGSTTFSKAALRFQAGFVGTWGLSGTDLYKLLSTATR